MRQPSFVLEEQTGLQSFNLCSTFLSCGAIDVAFLSQMSNTRSNFHAVMF